MNKFRTHNCSELTEKDIGKNIRLSGWIHRKRDHGNLLFLDIRDHFGITQCVIENKDKNFKILEKLKPESVILVAGDVVKRSKDTENKELKTGLIEVAIKNIERSYEKVNSFSNSIDNLSLTKASPINLQLIKKVLNELSLQ